MIPWRKGYAEMSRINLDICDEFEVCEKEVGAHSNQVL